MYLLQWQGYILTDWSFYGLPFVDLRQGVDYEDDGCAHDLLSNIGFLYAIRQILRLKEGALLYWALPCNSFSFMARSLHQRTMSDPFGHCVHKFVIAGNILATRVACLTMLAICRRVRFMIEQPDRSLAAVFPYFMHIFSFENVEIQRVFWWDPQFLKKHICGIRILFGTSDFFHLCKNIGLRWMGYFGGWSQKPTTWPRKLVTRLRFFKMLPSKTKVGFCLPLSKLSRWMPALYHPLEPGHRRQIKLRAASQKREMTIHTIQKGTNKRQVSFGETKVVTHYAILSRKCLGNLGKISTCYMCRL